MTIIITTSRRPKQHMRTLSRQLTKIIPYSKQINRGKSGLKQIKEFMSKQNYDKLILIEGLKNNEIRIVLNKLDKQNLVKIFTLDLINLELQKRDEEMSSSVETFTNAFSMDEIFSLASCRSSGVGKFSKSGGKTRGSFFFTKNSSVVVLLPPPKPFLTFSKASAHAVMKKKANIIILLNIFRTIFFIYIFT